jgi:hypothetical protein
MHGSESAIGKTIKHDLNLDKDFGQGLGQRTLTWTRKKN